MLQPLHRNGLNFFSIALLIESMFAVQAVVLLFVILNHPAPTTAMLKPCHSTGSLFHPLFFSGSSRDVSIEKCFKSETMELVVGKWLSIKFTRSASLPQAHTPTNFLSQSKSDDQGDRASLSLHYSVSVLCVGISPCSILSVIFSHSLYVVLLYVCDDRYSII